MKRERMEELRKIKTGFDFVMGLTPDWAEGRRAGLTDDQTEIIVNYVYQALSRNILALIDAEITRQSVTDEAVQMAIEQVENIKEYLLSEAQSEQHTQVTTDDDMALDLAITALQAYQPTTLKDRTVDEVAISKTETTSCPNADQHRRSK